MPRAPTNFTIRFLAPLLAAVLGACSMVPEYSRPAVPTPVGWGEPVAEPTAGARPGAGIETPWPSSDWWQGFDSPALAVLVVAAERNNTDIGQAAARVLQAEAQAKIAGADLLPSLDGSLGADRTWRGSGTTSTSGRGVSDSLSAELSVSYELDLFGKNRAALAAAEASLMFSRFDREAVALTVVSNVAQTYFQVLQFRERLAVALRILEITEGVLQVVTARVENGAASPLDLAQQRALVATQRASIPPLQAQLRQAENALAILLGTHLAALGTTEGALLDIRPPAPTAGLPSELIVRRPDIQAAEARLIAANAEIGSARAAYFPTISLTGVLGYESAALASLFNPASRSANIAGNLLQAIFRGGALEGQVELSEARFRELAESYRETVLTALGEVHDALVAARRTAEQEGLQAAAVEQARLAYQLAEARYRAGAVDLLTVLDAQRTLSQTEDQIVQIRFQRLQASVALFKALGGGWRLDRTAPEKADATPARP
ncbi:MAG: efflux transporter outer membrane subunit [Rhodospirillales bacterium]|nr:efflux transporter outer membrane subunit [Rhodospirillales bacterium]